MRKIAADFAAKNLPVTIFDIFSVPVDEKSLAADLKKCQSVLTVEENVLRGGLGSYILEIISDYHLNLSVKRLGIDFSGGVPNTFMNREYLRKLNGIDERGIVSTVNEILSWSIQL